MAFIDSGPVEATDKFKETPKSKWRFLMRAKRTFLATNINYDCRCLVEFVEEAEEVWQELEFESAEDMIRNGYELDPVEIELAVAWLKHNEPGAAIGLDDVARKVADARANPLPKHGEIGNGRTDESRVDNVKSTQGGNSTDYTLRRLSRDQPELLDAIERGELSVNAAAIKAGIRKKKSPAELVVANFRKCENRLEPLHVIFAELEPYEMNVIKGWIEDQLGLEAHHGQAIH